jgi:WD40 repeat protein
VATYAQDYTTRVYDTATGRRVALLRDPNDPRVQSAEFSPDGGSVATSTFLNTTYLWDAERGETLRSLPKRQPGGFNRIGADDAEFTRDGRVVATAYQDGRIRLWDASTGELLLNRRAEQRVADVEFSPQGERFLTRSTDGGVMTWTYPDVTPQFVLAPDDGDRDRQASFSANGAMVAVAEGGGTVRVWNEVGQQVATLAGHEGSVNEVNFDPSGRYLVSAGDDGSALVWDVSTERVVSRLDGHRAAVTSAEFSPNGSRVLTASLDGTARVWDSGTAEGGRALTPPGANGCGSAIFSRDGRTIAAGDCDGSAWVFDASGKAIRELAESPGGVDLELSADGRRLAVSDFGTDLHVYDVRTGRKLVSGRQYERLGAFSRDGSLVLLESTDGARVLDLRTGRRVMRPEDGTYGGGAAFGPGDDVLYTGSQLDTRIYAWELPSGKPLRRFRAPGLRRPSLFAQGVDGNEDIQLSRDGSRLLAVHITGSVRIIDTATGRTTVQMPGSEAPDERMFGGAEAIFSPDEESVATKAGWDNLVRIWDASTGRLQTAFEDHVNGVASVEYDQEGRLLATRDLNDTLRIWTATTGDVLLELRDARQADFSPDGRRVIVSDDVARVHRCEVCGDLDELLGLAERRVTRQMTAAERERYLHE